MEQTNRLKELVNKAAALAFGMRHEFLTPEHLLYYIMLDEELDLTVLVDLDKECYLVHEALQKHLDELERVPDEEGDYELLASQQLQEVLAWSQHMAVAAGREEVDIPHVVNGILNLHDSMANYLLRSMLTDDEGELMAVVTEAFNQEPGISAAQQEAKEGSEEEWRKLVTCINDHLKEHNPLIGREAELDRTIQVLCRREKNNPLHVGEPGVGKTAMVFGLAQRIVEGQVPERLLGARIYQMDMGQLVAGTSYRGEFEKRIRMIMEGARQEGNAIIYIDEIHTLVGAGAMGEGSLDGSNLLKPYLEGGDLRFVGSTTYQEFNRYMQKSRGLVRRFQVIDIAEPSMPEATEIVRGLKQRYEQFHHVTYADEALVHAVEASARLMNERFLPDKAIDLIDEAGSYREMHPLMRRYKGEMRRCTRQTVDKHLIDNVLARVCKIDPKMLHNDDSDGLETLADRIRAQVYGQDEAVNMVVQAVQMGKAGLLDGEKPIASLLFVGPTGVGKTEVCKVLASELGIELVRLDMSEYAEKHTVAKLIGSPAGYVGYEEGGLLTDAIRKTPHCVLLLDEIEKAHSDIYNILLQVMDYARLTDNKGQKADFRHVILIMTSNAGAQYAHQANLGFGATHKAGEAMMSAVKKGFKPEFLNRLTGTVTFNDMDRAMAALVLDKKLSQLQERLKARNVELTLSDEAHTLLLDKGFNPQYGAREMDRAINTLLTPLLTRELLFGSLKRGGKAMVGVHEASLLITH